MTRIRYATAAAALLATAATIAAAALKPSIDTSAGGLALRGYDAVAYWADGRPVRGTPRFEHRWNGAIWRFATTEHRERFARDPERYAPQFGGYCAYAVSRGYTAAGDPTVWRIVDDLLYVNYSPRAAALWQRDVPGNIAKGRRNWPAVLAR
jgi:hypothetical protein